MKKQHRDLWYSPRGPDAIVWCRECHAELVVRRGGMSDDMLKKKVQRERWEVGKSPHAHRCPECSRPRTKSATIIPLFFPADDALEQAWTNSTPQQRTQFWHKHREEMIYTLPSPDPFWQHGPHIDNMPKEANEPINANQQPAEVGINAGKSRQETRMPASRDEIDKFSEKLKETEPVLAEEDEPEDWWKELQK